MRVSNYAADNPQTAMTAVPDISMRGKRNWIEKLRIYVLFLMVGAIIGLSCGYVFSRGFTIGSKPGSAVMLREMIFEEIRHVQDLVTLEYYYRDVGDLKDQQSFYGLSVPFTERRILYKFRGIIKIGVDVSEIAVEVDEDAKTVTLTIPEGKLISHEMPLEDVEPYDEYVSFFNSFTMEDYAKLLSGRKQEVEQELLTESFLSAAQKEAGWALKELLKNMPAMDEYTLLLHYAGEMADAEAADVRHGADAEIEDTGAALPIDTENTAT